MPKVSKAKGKKTAARGGRTPARLSSSELSKKYGITADAVRKKMSRHGFRADKNRRYSEADFLRAHKAGLESDKARAAKAAKSTSDANSETPTLQAVLLDGKSRLLEIQIQKAQAELDAILGKVVPLDEHKATVQKVQLLMMTWFDQACENAATKIKNADVLRDLRMARDRASEQIMEALE